MSSFEETKKENFLAWVQSGVDVDFDMYSQDPGEWTWLQQVIPTVIVSSAGGIVPFQAEGLLHGHPFYYRDRGGRASLKVNHVDAENAYGSDVLWSASIDTEEFGAWETFFRNFVYLVDHLEKHPYLYYFKGYEVVDYKTAERTSETKDYEYAGWGFSAEEAYAYTREPSAYLVSAGISEDMQERMWLAREMESTPVKEDDRDYPAETPNFHVVVPEVLRGENGRVKMPADWGENNAI